MAFENPTKERTMAPPQPKAPETTSSARESAATWLAVAALTVLIALAAYWVGGVAVEGFRSLGRMGAL